MFYCEAHGEESPEQGALQEHGVAIWIEGRHAEPYGCRPAWTDDPFLPGVPTRSSEGFHPFLYRCCNVCITPASSNLQSHYKRTCSEAAAYCSLMRTSVHTPQALGGIRKRSLVIRLSMCDIYPRGPLGLVLARIW